MRNRGEGVRFKSQSDPKSPSIRRSCLEKKSAPSIGRGTSARKNSWEVRRFLKWRSRLTVPNVGIEVPFAARREVVEGEPDPLCADEGKTETSAPLSTRKFSPETRSDRHSDRDVVSAVCCARIRSSWGDGGGVSPGVIDARRFRFPVWQLPQENH